MVHYRRCGLQPRGLVPTSRSPPATCPQAVNSAHRRKPEGSWQQADVGSHCTRFSSLARAWVQVLLKPTGQAPWDTHPSNKVSCSLTPPEVAISLPWATRRTSGQLSDNQVLIFPLRWIPPLPGTKGIFSFRGPCLHWVHAYSPKVEEDCLKDAEWQREECHLNIPPPSRERFGWVSRTQV